MDKEKIQSFALYSVVVLMITVVFYVSYDYGLRNLSQEEIPVGQEYHVKEIVGTNSSFLVSYHENDENMTEKLMVQTAENQLNIVRTNDSQPVMVLDKIENHIKYWNIYVNDTQVKIN